MSQHDVHLRHWTTLFILIQDFVRVVNLKKLAVNVFRCVNYECYADKIKNKFKKSMILTAVNCRKNVTLGGKTVTYENKP